MALIPKDKRHESQIAAGTAGRNRGHKFEAVLSAEINHLENPRFTPLSNETHIFNGNPAVQLLQYIANDRDMAISGVRESASLCCRDFETRGQKGRRALKRGVILPERAGRETALSGSGRPSEKVTVLFFFLRLAGLRGF